MVENSQNTDCKLENHMENTTVEEFKLIVAGGRTFNDYTLLSNTLFEMAEHPYFETKGISIVSGMARGADALAVRFTLEHNVVLYEFPADWNTHGKSAGYVRNNRMAEIAHGLLAFWDGQSRGTAHMIQKMESLGKFVHAIRY